VARSQVVSYSSLRLSFLLTNTLKLMEKHQNTDPFKFIIYSGKIGAQTPQMTAPK
jgi:hypothetical protein